MAKKKTIAGKKLTSAARSSPSNQPTGGAMAGLATQSLLVDIHYATLVDRFLKFIRRYQQWLVAVVVFALVISLAVISWNFYQQSQAKKISEEFYALLGDKDIVANPDKLVNFAVNHSKGAGAGYGALASVMALQLIEKNKNDATQTNLKNTIEKAVAQNPYLRDVAALRSGDEKTLRNLTVAAQNSSMINLALADRLTAAGKKDEAKKTLQTIAINNQNNLLGLLMLQILPNY